MSDHFRAFSFVDRILEVDPGISVTGEYRIPEEVDEFPMALCAESLGQCAAWSAMKTLDFAVRPVAGIVGKLTWTSQVRPGQTLRLSAGIRRIDEEAIAYQGTVSVDGEEVMLLKNCLGPMVPMADFDDPAAVESRYELLVGEGAEPGAYGGVPPLGVDREGSRGVLTVPESAAFFQDHFPRKPVLPGTLQMNANLLFATAFANDELPPANGKRWKAVGVAKVKIRDFTEPGETLELEAEPVKQEDNEAIISVVTKKNGKQNSSVRVLLTASQKP